MDGRVCEHIRMWIEQQLVDAPPFVFVIGHEPAFPQDAYHMGDSLDKYPTDRNAFWQLLNDHGVLAYICGHTHCYSTYTHSTGPTVQIDCGNAGNPSHGDPFQTFVVFDVTDAGYVQVTPYQGLQGENFDFAPGSSFQLRPPEGPPQARLTVPLDNGPDDLEPARDQVTVNTTQSYFQIQLTDSEGIDDSTVTSDTVSIADLTSGTDYAFAYDGDADGHVGVITLTPLTSGVFENGTYAITVSGISDVATPANTMTGTVLTVLIDTSIVPPQTLSFQQGLDGYADAVDTMVRGAAADTPYATSSIITTDADDASGWSSHVLLRFDGIIGGALDQIPPYASINSATLRLRSLDSGNGGSLHAMLQSWSDTATWNSLVDGIQTDDTEALSAADDSISANSAADVDLDVTATVQGWVDSTMENNGWAVLPNGTDGWDIASAEHGTAEYRPELIVTFVATGDRPPVADAGPDQTVEDTDGNNEESITLDGSGSYHPEFPNAWIISYAWDVDGDEMADYEGEIVDVLLAPGEHTVTLTVTDNGGATATDTVLIDVQSVDYDAYVSQEPSVTYGVVSGTVAGTLAQGDGQTQRIMEVPNGTAGRTSLQVDYLLHTTANPDAVTVMELHLSADWTAADVDDPLQVSIWNGTAWEDISDDILADNLFAPGNPTAYVDSSGDIRVRFSDTAAIKKETKDTLTLDLLYAYITAGYVDNPPSVSIADPVDEQTVYDAHRILVAADDDNALKKVELQIDGAAYMDITDDVAGGYFYYDWTIPSDGLHTLQARATDDAGQVSESSIVTVTGDMIDDPPTAGIVNPSTGSTVSGVVTIQVQAQDDRDSGTDDLDVFARIDEAEWVPTLYNAATGYYELDWDTTGYTNGPHTIEAYALDRASQPSDLADASVIVDNSVVVQAMYVDSVVISAASRQAGKNEFVHAYGTIQILNANGGPVAETTVYASWSGVVSATQTGVTNADGYVTFVSEEVKNPTVATFTFTVDDVVKSGWEWVYEPPKPSGSITY